jgi:hypothetical protein
MHLRGFSKVMMMAVAMFIELKIPELDLKV